MDELEADKRRGVPTSSLTGRRNLVGTPNGNQKFLPEEDPVQEGSFLRAVRARLAATSQQQSPIVLSYHMK